MTQDEIINMTTNNNKVRELLMQMYLIEQEIKSIDINILIEYEINKLSYN